MQSWVQWGAEEEKWEREGRNQPVVDCLLLECPQMMCKDLADIMKCILLWHERGRMWKYCPYTLLTVWNLCWERKYIWRKVPSDNFSCVNAKHTVQIRHVGSQHFSQGPFQRAIPLILTRSQMFQIQKGFMLHPLDSCNMWEEKQSFTIFLLLMSYRNY